MCRRFIHLTCSVLVLGLMTTVAHAKISDGLVGYWPLDEGAGDITADRSGNGNDGTINQPVWDVGKFGGALNFDGVDDYVDCGNPTILDFGTSDFTISAWIKTSDAAGETIFGNGGDDSGGIRYRLFIEGNPGVKILVDDNATKYDPEGDIPVVDGQWHHIVGMRIGTALRVYIDGVEDQGVTTHGESTIPATYDISGTSQHNAYIGAQASHSGGTLKKFFGGLIDDVALWTRALSVEEISYLWNGGDGNPVDVAGPGQASDPSPDIEQTDVSRDVVLSWTPGEFAPAVNGHIVYFSEGFSDVNDGVAGTTVSSASYDPGRLQFSTTYYWRVDEVNAPPDSTVFPGEVWQFTTEPVGYAIDGANIIATASSTSEGDFGPEKTIDGSGMDANDLHSAEATDMWLSGDEPQGAWIQYELDKVYKLHEMWVWNGNQVFESLFGFGFKTVTVEYSIDGAAWTTLEDVPEFARAPGASDYAHSTTVDFGDATAKYVKLTATSNWGGVLPQYNLSEVRFFSIPVSARVPSPDSGATDVNPNVTLTWRAGREAATHEVYLSSDQQAVIDGTAPVVNVTGASYSTALDLASTYYWRVDEVNEAETPTTWQGDVWDFTTQQSLVVDDFEDYNDYPSYEIYSTWLDGYENPANGSQVGYLTPPIAETTIVHGGGQSMPLIYSNTGGATYSEATRTFAVPQDWTKYGIETLQLWFYGTAGNTGQLYVKINGVKVPYSGDAANLAVESWQSWDIDLTTVGVNIQSVTSLAIGLDDNAAAGTLYIDDIQLQ